MSRRSRLAALAVPCLSLALGSCGGGESSAAASEVRLRLEADPVVLAAGNDATLTVRLVGTAATPAALLQCDVELPPALELAAKPLEPAATLPTLAGERKDGKYRVVCGDAANPQPALLPFGPLFSLHVRAREPRVPGVHDVRLTGVRIAGPGGEPMPADATATLRVTVE